MSFFARFVKGRKVKEQIQAPPRPREEEIKISDNKSEFFREMLGVLAGLDQYQLQVRAHNDLFQFGLADHCDNKYGYTPSVFPFKPLGKLSRMVRAGIERGWLPEEFRHISHLRMSTSSASTSCVSPSGPHMSTARGPTRVAMPSSAAVVVPPQKSSRS